MYLAVLAHYNRYRTPTYHGIYANFALLHSKRADFMRQITECYQSLHPGGVLHLGMKLGTGEARDALGRFYTYYSAQELRDTLEHAGFTITHTQDGEEPGLAGPVEPYTMIFAHA